MEVDRKRLGSMDRCGSTSSGHTDVRTGLSLTSDHSVGKQESGKFRKRETVDKACSNCKTVE